MTKHTIKTRLLKLLPAAAILLATYLCPGWQDLPSEAVSAAGVLLSALWLWSSEALPMSASILLLIGVTMAEGLLKPIDALRSCDWKTALFVVASSGITAVMAGCTIPRRMTRWLLRLSQNRAGVFVLGFGLLVCVCSSVMSSLATCALFAGMADELLGNEKSSLRRCLMLVIPACAGIGGFMTPAGTPANLLVLSMLESSGSPIRFWQWCVIGIPLGLVTTVLFVISAVRVIRPDLRALHLDFPLPTRLQQRKDRLTLIMILLMLTGWIMTSWVHAITLWQVACIGVLLMLLPPIRILDLRRLWAHIHWDLVLTMGTVGLLMGAVTQSGLTAWLCQRMVAPLTSLSPTVMLVVVSVEVCCIRAFIPTTTGAVMLLAPLLLELAALTGQSAAVLLMILAYWTACALLLVYTEPIYLLTWQRKDYSALDLLRIGALPSLLMATLGAPLIRALTLLVGR